jgi:hypothetical protein
LHHFSGYFKQISVCTFGRGVVTVLVRWYRHFIILPVLNSNALHHTKSVRCSVFLVQLPSWPQVRAADWQWLTRSVARPLAIYDMKYHWSWLYITYTVTLLPLRSVIHVPNSVAGMAFLIWCVPKLKCKNLPLKK